ncbi:MAG: sensor histidine kinase [Acidimicrobiia bacterium]
MSLKWRIALGLAGVAALVSASVATLAYVSTETRLRDNLDQALVARAESLTQFPNPGAPDNDRGDGDRGGPCPPAGLLEPANAARSIATDGTVTNCLAGGETLPPELHEVEVARTSGRIRLATVPVGGHDYRIVTVARTDGSVLQLGRSLRDIETVLDSLRTRLLLIACAGIGAAAILGWLLAIRIVAPVTRLQRAAEHIARTGDLDTDLPAGGAGEVGSLAGSFATMVGALADSRARQQRLIADASHELRTPLTSLQTNAELLARPDLTAPQREQVSDGIRFEVHELTDLVSELVTLARDPDSDREPVETVALDDLASTAVETARLRTEREITIHLDAPATLSGRPRALTRALTNLLDNAIKYGDGPIGVTVARTTVTVRDHGPGIPPADLPHVFDRFYRSDAARTMAGSGLGLAIVAQVVERHGGTVFARNAPDGGAEVGFTL